MIFEETAAMVEEKLEADAEKKANEDAKIDAKTDALPAQENDKVEKTENLIESPVNNIAENDDNDVGVFVPSTDSSFDKILKQEQDDIDSFIEDYRKGKTVVEKQQEDDKEVEKQDIVSNSKNDLNFINAQSKLKIRLSDIQEELSLQSNDPNINNLTDLIENAKDLVVLSKVERKIKLLEQKVPYLKKVNSERTNNASNKTVSKSLLELYNKIVSSNNVDGDNWEKELKRILETKSSTICYLFGTKTYLCKTIKS